MDSSSRYNPPMALNVVSGVFLILGAICFLIIAVDIIWRRGWRSMMGVMIPVYPINAAYMLPVELYVYFKYGRPAKPTPAPPPANASSEPAQSSHCHSTPNPANSGLGEEEHHHNSGHEESSSADASLGDHKEKPLSAYGNSDSDAEKAEPAGASHCCHNAAPRPMLATVLVGVSHCGAGCVLGDIVGEWLVYGTGAKINGQSIWVELMVDYAFALLFGIAFQYFSIAPMSGEWGPKTVWRAAKADILSLTSFEVGAFGWMVIYQVGIFNYQLSILTWTYWWMMQIGMAFGFATAIPMNYYLISKGIKEPCA